MLQKQILLPISMGRSMVLLEDLLVSHGLRLGRLEGLKMREASFFSIIFVFLKSLNRDFF